MPLDAACFAAACLPTILAQHCHTSTAASKACPTVGHSSKHDITHRHARDMQAEETLTFRSSPQGGKPVPPPMLDEAASLEVMELTPAPVPSGFGFLGESGSPLPSARRYMVEPGASSCQDSWLLPSSGGHHLSQ